MSTTPISTEVGQRFCGNCGHEVRPRASFCETCGQTMARHWPAQSPAGPAQPPAGAAGQAGSRPWLMLAVAALVLAAIAGPVVLVAHPFGGHPPGTGTMTTPAEQQAAESLAPLLAQSAADRTTVRHADDDVWGCGPDLSADAQVFENAAVSRRRLVSELADLPSRSALPPHMLQELTGAWQASAAVDSDYARWALDEGAGTCVPGDRADPNFQAALGPNDQATRDKLAFTQLWNQLADSYGLTQYGDDRL